MQFTAALAILTVTVRLAAADSGSPGCIERNGVQICSGGDSPPVISIGPDGCTGLEINGVQFCTTTGLEASTMHATSTNTVATARTTPTTQPAANTAPATGTNSTTQPAANATPTTGTNSIAQAAAATTPASVNANSTTQAAATPTVVTGDTNSNSAVQTSATAPSTTPSTASGSARISSLPHPVVLLFLSYFCGAAFSRA